PPPQIFDRRGVDGLVGASVRLPVSLIVALEIHASGGNATDDGRLPDGASNLAAVELEGTRPPHVDGEHSSVGTRHFPFLPAAGQRRGSCISYPDRRPEASRSPGVESRCLRPGGFTRGRRATRSVDLLWAAAAGSRFGAHPLHGVGLLAGVALFFPRIGVKVIAVDLPESRRVDVEELERPDPLGALPKVQLWDDEPAGASVLGREVLPVV